MCVPKDLWKPAPGKRTGGEARASAHATHRAAYRGGTQHTDPHRSRTVATNQSDRGAVRNPHRAMERTPSLHHSLFSNSRTRWVGGCEKK